MTSRVHPHAPERGRAARLLGRFHVTGAFWFRLHSFASRALPEPAIGPTILVFTAFFFCTLLRIRRAIASNLEAVLGPCGFVERQRRIWRTFHVFAWCLTERYERLAGRGGFRFDAEGDEHWRAAAGDRRGAVLVTGHMGNWEVGAALPSGHDRRVHLVREAELDPEAQSFIESLLRERTGTSYTTHFAALDLRLAILLREALERGELVALQGDRPRAGGRTVPATLFGRPFALPAGPAVLSRTAGAPLLPVFVVRTGRRRYRVAFEPPFRIPRTADRAADLRAGAEAFAAALERRVRADPHQWFCFRTLWPS